MRIFVSSLLLGVGLAGAADAGSGSPPGDPERGREVFGVCMPCHEIGETAKHRTGPALARLFGRPAGRIEGYPSSLPMTAAGLRGLVWTDETLERFLQDPEAMVPGTDMPFIGLERADDRADLLAYLHAVGGSAE